MTRPRLGLLAKVLFTLCAVAALSTALALHLQHRSLSADLRSTATERLERAAAAADRLVTSHLETVVERYSAISDAPQFRANLEVRHATTLAYYANLLREQQNASAVLFLEPNAELFASAGSDKLVRTAIELVGRSPLPSCDAWRVADSSESIAQLAALGLGL